MLKEIEISVLSQLKDIIPKSAHGANTTMYTIALEGWRRGLTLKFFTKYIKDQVKIRYSLSNEEREIDFQLSLAEIVPKEARNITRSKEKTKKILLNANVPTPKGGSFNEDHADSEIINFAKSLQYPLVIKPANSSLGRGVITGISNEEMLKDSLKQLREKMGYQEIIVEQEVTGDDTRLFVVGDQVICAFKRVAANVTGDGQNTIKQLIEIKNNLRKKNPHLGGSQITIDKNMHVFLSGKGLTIETVPDVGEYVLLSASTIASNGAETVDVTDELTEENKEVAVKAAKTLPGLSVCGIDIMIDRERETSFVLELNSRPNIGGSVFPEVGQQRNIPKAIVDYYFPESQIHEVDERSSKYYFDYESISNILRNGIVKEVVVPPIPRGQIVAKKLTVSGKVQGVGFRQWVYNKAVGRKLNGYVKNLKNKTVVIVVTGNDEKVEQFIDKVKVKRSKKMRVENVNIQNWDKPVKMGFEIKRAPSNSATLRKQLNTEREKNNELVQLNQQTKKRLDSIEQSKSWKYTLPARKIVKILKRD